MPSYSSQGSSIIGYEIILDSAVLGELSDAEEEVRESGSFLSSFSSGEAVLLDAQSVLSTVSRLAEGNWQTLLSSRFVGTRVPGQLLGYVRAFQSATENFQSWFSFALDVLSLVPGPVGTGVRLAKATLSVIEGAREAFSSGDLSALLRLTVQIARTANRLASYLSELSEEFQAIEAGQISYEGSNFEGQAIGITIIYRDGSVYTWLASRVGQGSIDIMIGLAESGSGLGSWMYHNVRYQYS